MASKFPQSATPIACQIKTAWASKLAAVYWPAGADKLHRIRPGETVTTIVTRATSGAGFNAAEGRITGPFSEYFLDSDENGFSGLTENSDLTFGADVFGTTFYGNTPDPTVFIGTKDPSNVYDFGHWLGGEGFGFSYFTRTVSKGLSSSDVEQSYVLAVRFKADDPVAKQRGWANGVEISNWNSNLTDNQAGDVGKPPRAIRVGGSSLSGNVKIEFGGAWFGNGTLTDSDMNAMSSNPGDAIELLGGGGGDSTAPTLSAAVGTQTGATTATVGATTNEATGTMYQVVTTSANAPSVAQIQAGQNGAGAAAVWAGNVAVSSTGAKTFSATGLTASTQYYGHTQHKDAAGNDSAVLTSAPFTTAASGGGGGGTVTGLPLSAPGGPFANLSGLKMHVFNAAGDLVVSKSNQTADSAGVPAVTDAAVTTGTDYYILVIQPKSGQTWGVGVTDLRTAT